MVLESQPIDGISPLRRMEILLETSIFSEWIVSCFAFVASTLNVSFGRLNVRDSCNGITLLFT